MGKEDGEEDNKQLLGSPKDGRIFLNLEEDAPYDITV
jgi:hypothetical protein